MDIFLWVLQGLLALVFLMAGFSKLVMPYEKLVEQMGWCEDYSPTQIRLIAITEVLGAIGLIIPLATGILPWLTPLAAAGLVINQVVASRVHARRGGEEGMMRANYVLSLLALVVAIGRFFVLPVL